MGFDLKKFRKAKWQPRTEKLPIYSEAYGAFFPEGEEKAFIVKGLTGEEMFAVNEAEKKASIQKAVLEILSSSKFKEVDAIKELMGESDNPSADFSKAVETVRFGMSDPEMELQDVVLFAKTSGMDFKNAFHTILNLSGRGMDVGEPSASGKTPKSKQRSTSDTPGANCSTS